MYALEIVLFYPGILGVGKTLLASIVINHLLSTFRDENIGIAYVFCSYQSRRKQNPIAIFSSLLEQMLIQSDSIPGNFAFRSSDRILLSTSFPGRDPRKRRGCAKPHKREHVKTALKMLPKGSNALDSTYGQAIERISSQNPDIKSLVEETSSWITYARRPLRD